MDKVGDETWCNSYLGDYKDDKLTMKWNEQWDICNENADDTAESCLGAWTTNHWQGMKGDGTNAVWFYKMIWVGPENLIPTGEWKLNFVFGDSYPHTMNITSYDSETGNFTGTGVFDNDNSYTWNVTGNINGSDVTMHILYTGTNAGYYVDATGTLSSDGTLISGNWLNLSQSGTWTGNGLSTTNNGPYWREGGYRIWGSYEVITDMGKDPFYGGGHQVFAKGMPNGLK